MTFDDALASARKVGARRASGRAALALACNTLHVIHPGVSPRLLYEGAVRAGLTDRELIRMGMDGLALSDVMFSK